MQKKERNAEKRTKTSARAAESRRKRSENPFISVEKRSKDAVSVGKADRYAPFPRKHTFAYSFDVPPLSFEAGVAGVTLSAWCSFEVCGWDGLPVGTAYVYVDMDALEVHRRLETRELEYRDRFMFERSEYALEPRQHGRSNLPKMLSFSGTERSDHVCEPIFMNNRDGKKRGSPAGHPTRPLMISLDAEWSGDGSTTCAQVVRIQPNLDVTLIPSQRRVLTRQYAARVAGVLTAMIVRLEPEKASRGLLRHELVRYAEVLAEIFPGDVHLPTWDTPQTPPRKKDKKDKGGKKGRSKNKSGPGAPQPEKEPVPGTKAEGENEKIPPLRIVLITHFGVQDVGTSDDAKLIYRKLTPIGKAAVSLRSLKFAVRSAKPFSADKPEAGGWVRVRLDVRDTMALLPAGKKSLASVGQLIDVPKVELPEGAIEDMEGLLHRDIGLYFRYAATDAIVALRYTETLFGSNMKADCTMGTAVARVVSRYLKDLLTRRAERIRKISASESASFSSAKELALEESQFGRMQGLDKGFDTEDILLLTGLPTAFGRGYRRKTAVKKLEQYLEEHGLGGPGLAKRHKERLVAVEELHRRAGRSYFGGLNMSYSSGPRRNGPYFDYDLKSAYPTAMSQCSLADWDGIRTFEEVEVPYRFPGSLRSDPLASLYPTGLPVPSRSGVPFEPFLYGFGTCDFRFPQGTEHPCLPQLCRKGGGLIFTLSGRNVPFSLPELRLAWLMGAELFIHEISVVPYLMEPDGTFFSPMNEIVRDLTYRRGLYPKGSLMEIRTKEFVNTIYGKLAQGSIRTGENSQRWSPSATSNTPMSLITNTPMASHLTSLVRASLSAAAWRLSEQGDDVESITTDGIVTNAPPKVMEALGYGADFLDGSLRYFKGPDFAPFELKHDMNEFINIKTRGNIATTSAGTGSGIMAKAGFRSDDPRYVGSSPKTRSNLADLYLRRTGPIKGLFKTIPGFREIYENDYDGTVKLVERLTDWEPDGKRFFYGVETVECRGVEHAVFLSRPWAAMDDYYRFRTDHDKIRRWMTSSTARSLDYRTTEYLKMLLNRSNRRLHGWSRLPYPLSQYVVVRTFVMSAIRALRAGFLRFGFFDENSPCRLVLDYINERLEPLRLRLRGDWGRRLAEGWNPEHGLNYGSDLRGMLTFTPQDWYNAGLEVRSARYDETMATAWAMKGLLQGLEVLFRGTWTDPREAFLATREEDLGHPSFAKRPWKRSGTKYRAKWRRWHPDHLLTESRPAPAFCPEPGRNLASSWETVVWTGPGRVTRSVKAAHRRAVPARSGHAVCGRGRESGHFGLYSSHSTISALGWDFPLWDALFQDGRSLLPVLLE